MKSKSYLKFALFLSAAMGLSANASVVALDDFEQALIESIFFSPQVLASVLGVLCCVALTLGRIRS